MLFTLGVMWVTTGVDILATGFTTSFVGFAFQPGFLEPDTRGWLWVATGSVAILTAVRPRIFVHDGFGYLALYAMPAYRAGAYLWLWLDSWLPMGGPGYPRGWLAATGYLALTALVMILADVHEPGDGG